ncbi:MAG: hypothetical protein GAK29_03594 [Acinetobacter bereziniae]|uniref:Uncharacterized protein n=1 Tax=Acinetobacter bereziniae TaxID=106648 RepID=A0A833UL12_ACIBZ|nr:MAG: hypothetical protein GAK29_03594 [Acinetobacter bereziniae]
MNNLTSKKTPKVYSSTDMVDTYLIAERDMQWMNIAISDIKKHLKEIKSELGDKNVAGFYTLENMVDMYQYISEKRFSYYNDRVEFHQAEESETNKKAVTL